MDPLLQIRDLFNELSTGLRLEEEELPSIFDGGLLDSAEELESLISGEFSRHLAHRAADVTAATRTLVDEPSPEAMALVLNRMNRLVVESQRELAPLPTSCEWRLARQYSDIAGHLSGPNPAENQGFHDLPRMLAESRWLKSQFDALAASADLSPARTPLARGFSPLAAKRWVNRVNRKSESQLAGALDHLQHGLEYRLRQVWFLRRSDGEERSLPHLYVLAHADLYPDLNTSLSERRLELEVAKLKGLALGLQLPEFALCLESAEWMSNYAFSYLLPPSPSDWPIRQASHLGHLLKSRLSRWYFCAFEHDLEPLEMAAAILRIGRPLFYERVAAHALLEYSLLQGIAFTRASAPFYLDALAVLESEFQTLFDGYLLRLMHYPNLKAPEGWCAYLEALFELHYGSGWPQGLESFRKQFFARRGLQSCLDILYRTVESHSSVN